MRLTKSLIAAAALIAPAFAACAQADETPAEQPAAETAAPAPDPAEANPALWVVRDPDTTIYLFGTFHLLPGDIDWYDPDVAAAFDAADELVVETLPPEGGGAAVLQRLALAEDGVPLSEKLDEEQMERLIEAVAPLGMTEAAAERFDPWFIATLLALAEYQRLGLSAENGAEMRLLSIARQRGVEIETLEGFEEQLQFFETMPTEMQVRMLVSSLDEFETFADDLPGIVAAWAGGDDGTLDETLNASMDEFPELRERLLTRRNENWAVWIDERLDEPGTVFLAVGVGHLVGEDSVQDMLAARDIAAERIQ